MKTSIINIAALVLNVILMVAESLSTIMKASNSIFLIGIEFFFGKVFFANKWLRAHNKACIIELGYLDVCVVVSK